MKKIILGLIVMMAMIGTAAASFEMDIIEPVPNEVVIGNMAGIDYTIDLTGILYNAHTIKSTITTGNTGDLQFSFDGGSAWLSSGAMHSWGPDNTGNQQLTMKVRCPSSPTEVVGFDYFIEVEATDSDGSTVTQRAIATTTTTSIPEFPTVALPVAAILGLAFIFQRRREED